MIGITLDIDWAPDFVIDDVAARLLAHGTRATWFVTHASPAVERLRARPELFELGIHPNFLPGSSHGATPSEVLRTCMQLVPDAGSMRTHSLVQSTPLLAAVAAETPVRTDVSVYLPRHPGLHPVTHWIAGVPMVRVPYLWEDDFEMDTPAPDWDLVPLLQGLSGLRVEDFHPIHVYLNSPSFAPYASAKRRVPRLPEASRSDLEPFRHDGAGAGTAFDALLGHLATSGGGVRVRDIAPPPASRPANAP